MQTTYIFGHRNPDTDSICSSIALSYLKNKLGEKTIPRASGHLNNETKFVLKYFGIPEPQYINDVRIRLKNIKYDKKAAIHMHDTILNAYKHMTEQKITAVPVIDDNKKIVGFVAMKDLARYLIDDKTNHINTSFDNILKTLNGDTVVKVDDDINGNVKVIAAQRATLEEEIKLNKNDIIIVGDRYKILNYAIESKVKMIVISFNLHIADELIEKAIDNNVNIIRCKMSSFEIAKTILLSNYLISINSKIDPVIVCEDDYYQDFITLQRKTNYTNYPVVNRKNECLGSISMSWPNEYHKQKVILVDHNNFAQSVEGIEEADIQEIYDHHNLGSIGTSNPIVFRCMTVGCTATLIYDLFKENRVEIPKDIAGIMLSSIISDTLLFTSPTTTEKDKRVANNLATIAEVDVKKYGIQMLKAASSVKDLTVNEQIFQDYKSYNVGDQQIGIGQLVTLDFEDLSSNIDEYVKRLDELRSVHPGVYLLFVTDILSNGSYVIYDTKSEDIIKDSFNLDHIEQGIFVKGLVSRKKQILPPIMERMGL